jgi:hypothetical protein
VGFQLKSIGRPTRRNLTDGSAPDYTQAMPLIEGQRAEKIVADNGYGSRP